MRILIVCHDLLAGKINKGQVRVEDEKAYTGGGSAAISRR